LLKNKIYLKCCSPLWKYNPCGHPWNYPLLAPNENIFPKPLHRTAFALPNRVSISLFRLPSLVNLMNFLMNCTISKK